MAAQLFADRSQLIIITPGIRAEQSRRFFDQFGRWPTPEELTRAIGAWKRDESTYREALRQKLDTQDPMVRTLLINRLRERIALETPAADPTPEQAAQWLLDHRDLYETPVIYEYVYATFPRNDPAALQQRADLQKRLTAGATPESLGVRTVAAKISRDQMRRDLGDELTKRVCDLPKGEWASLDGEDKLILAKMINVEGGVPSVDAIRDRLVADYKNAQQQTAVDKATDDFVMRYKFEERSQ